MLQQRRGLAMAGPALVGCLVLANPASAAPNQWTPWNSEVVITGPLQVRLAYTDTNGATQNLALGQLAKAAANGLPGGLKEVRMLPVLQPGYFDHLWSAIRGAVCNQVKGEITQQVNFSPNSAYDVRCQTNPKGILKVSFATQWENDQFQHVTGRRLVLDYWVPLNGATFYVTSPGTCHAGSKSCGVEPTDPQFTATFSVHITTTSTSSNQASFSLPVTSLTVASLATDGVDGGDLTGGLVTAAEKWAATAAVAGAAAAASGGTAGVGVLVASTAKLLADAAATAIAGVVDQHLRDEVSSRIQLGSAAASNAATNVSTQFEKLYKGLYDAQLEGLSEFSAFGSSDGSLDFGVAYPVPAKPTLQNKIAASNGQSLFSPSIFAGKADVQPGAKLTVNAQYFGGTFSDLLKVDWNRTVIGTPISTVSWGPKGGTILSASALNDAFEAKNLKPNTTYQFRVRECDGVTCAPWSDWLTTTTQAGGSGKVSFWLDGDTAHPVGSANARPNGAPFTVSVKLPAKASPGAHTINAALPGGRQASTTITVCAKGGCAASLAMVNTSDNQLFPATPPRGVMVTGSVTVRGSGFQAGGTVTIYVDGTNGAKSGSATVGSKGAFQIAFSMPMVIAGVHNLVAVEVTGGMPPGTKFVDAASRRKKKQQIVLKSVGGQTTQATLPIFVQAQAQ